VVGRPVLLLAKPVVLRGRLFQLGLQLLDPAAVRLDLGSMLRAQFSIFFRYFSKNWRFSPKKIIRCEKKLAFFSKK
jgi:hypothetical protein